MVNWNSKFAAVGSQFPATLEILEMRSENGQLIAVARLVDLPDGVSAGNITLSGVPGPDEEDDDKKPKKK